MDLTELILDIAKQGPLVGLLLYIMVRNQKQIDELNERIENLHGENKSILKEELGKTRETANNSTQAINTLKDFIKLGAKE